MHLDQEELQVLGLAALLHESGWLKLPIHLLGKGKPYSKQERELVERHIPYGSDLLRFKQKLPNIVIQLVEQHHERNDGSGYPLGLVSRDIHPLSKILAVADVYDEMTNELLDRPAETAYRTLQILYQAASKSCYDQPAVAHLINLLGVYPLGSAVLLSSGEKGLVTEINNAAPTLPIMQIFYEANGRRSIIPSTVDLSDADSGGGRVINRVLDPREPGVDPANLLVFNDRVLHKLMH